MSLDSCHRMDASSIGPAMRASRSATVQRKRGVEDVAFAEGPMPEDELGPFADLRGPVFASDDGLAA